MLFIGILNYSEAFRFLFYLRLTILCEEGARHEAILSPFCYFTDRLSPSHYSLSLSADLGSACIVITHTNSQQHVPHYLLCCVCTLIPLVAPLLTLSLRPSNHGNYQPQCVLAVHEPGLHHAEGVGERGREGRGESARKGKEDEWRGEGGREGESGK